jgi:hypothetical protein
MGIYLRLDGVRALFKENFTERQTEINPEGTGASKT